MRELVIITVSIVLISTIGWTKPEVKKSTKPDWVRHYDRKQDNGVVLPSYLPNTRHMFLTPYSEMGIRIEFSIIDGWEVKRNGLNYFVQNKQFKEIYITEKLSIKKLLSGSFIVMSKERYSVNSIYGTLEFCKIKNRKKCRIESFYSKVRSTSRLIGPPEPIRIVLGGSAYYMKNGDFSKIPNLKFTEFLNDIGWLKFKLKKNWFFKSNVVSWLSVYDSKNKVNMNNYSDRTLGIDNQFSVNGDLIRGQLHLCQRKYEKGSKTKFTEYNCVEQGVEYNILQTNKSADVLKIEAPAL